MHTRKKMLLISLFLFIPLNAALFSNASQIKDLPPITNSLAANDLNYVKSAYVSDEEWNLLRPYFVPASHPIKPVLDRAFSKTEGELSKKALKKAGFEVVSYGNTTIAKHPDMKGYLLKFYLDSNEMIEAPQFYRRIVGAERAKEVISANQFQRDFIVPIKMVYPIYRGNDRPRKDIYYRKHFVMVVEEMNILSKAENEKKYREELTKRQMDQLYIFLDETGLYDLVYIDNIPFSKDGRFAILDTEDYDKKYVRFNYFAKWLSQDSAAYWQELIKQGGPKHSIRPGSPWSSSASYRKHPADLLDMGRLKRTPD